MDGGGKSFQNYPQNIILDNVTDVNHIIINMWLWLRAGKAIIESMKVKIRDLQWNKFNATEWQTTSFYCMQKFLPIISALNLSSLHCSHKWDECYDCLSSCHPQWWWSVACSSILTHLGSHLVICEALQLFWTFSHWWFILHQRLYPIALAYFSNFNSHSEHWSPFDDSWVENYNENWAVTHEKGIQ